ncbi:hypothetical protein HZA39_03200 [Candidatus Peregrinibacteria bacterium]|nr:hypothetical protein [Candidatus Peregrinibacteria bacterium]
MFKTCKNCEAQFQITQDDSNFYKKIDAPEPVECYDCRQQRRLAYRNERNLYQGICDKCKKQIISIYSPDKPYTVYCNTCWWGDDWDPMEYGVDFDPEHSGPFFPQWQKLYDAVPKISLIVLGDNINSDYTHDVYRLKDCYLVFDGEQARDCYYGETFIHLVDCVDFLALQRSELCYETINSFNCYNCSFTRFCKDCAESNFLIDCIGCKNCFFCANLRQKQYCIFNKQYSREEYRKKAAEINLGDYKTLQKVKKDFEKFVITSPKKAMRGVQNENVSGDNIDNCKNVFYSFDCVAARDCKYCTNIEVGANDCFDVDIWGDNLNLAYNSECVGAGSQNIIASYYTALTASNIYYSAFAMNGVHNLFGCVALRHKKFCILNKQYSEKEYRALFPRILSRMKSTGEWGQFFPISTSPFGYNETVAQDFFPITRLEALKKGYKWKPKDMREHKAQTYKIPDNITSVPNSITDEILACEDCGKNYKIIAQELRFYRKKNLPIPRKCYVCRYKDRLSLRNPRKLWKRICKKCGVSLQSSYEQARPEPIYCEKCYLEII